LLRDMVRLSQYFLPFEELEIERLFRRIRLVEYNETIELGNDVAITFLDAGHIPGSAAIRVNTPSHEVLYTGDINTINTQLLQAAKLAKAAPDALVLESTYALTAHRDRTEIEEEFVETAATTIDNGGTVLVPAFAVARAQEILCILARYKAQYPIYMDGMAREASRIFLQHPDFFRDYKLLKRALRNTNWIRNRRQRESVAKKPGLVVAPAGMLRGGSAAMYMSHIMHDPKNAILLVGYQIPGTPGRELLDHGTFDDGNGVKRVKAQYQLFDFSSHAGQNQLLSLASSFPKVKEIFTVHGEADACTFLAKTLRKQNSINARAVEIGEHITLKE
ncbi:MAG: MBL fold metallo-hydrolase, partial [Candidatus Hermodarchaeota archaeon]|nr:MBL fold metallo-hydrolase [Candidatus Hermodarchaeota archaeon]